MLFLLIQLELYILIDWICSLEPHLQIIGICYYPSVLKDEKKEHKLEQ